MRFVDLFAGIGGTRLGLEQACKQLGINPECVFSSEIDPCACETYESNFGDYPSGDIREISAESIPQFDFLLAGFPCQPFSYAGKQQGFGDTRGTLFFEIERILDYHRPKAFLLENVRGLTTHDKGRTLRTIITRLESMGYGVNYLLLNSSCYGVPQNRVRIYILGIRGEEPNVSLVSNLGSPDSHQFKKRVDQDQLSLPGFVETTKQVLVEDILESNPESKYVCSDLFIEQLGKVVKGNFESLAGKRLIDYRGGNSIHSWELGVKGECSEDEINFMNALISNRRRKEFGRHQDGKMLNVEQIRTFFDHEDLDAIIFGLVDKGYLKEIEGRYNPVCGNMSFEVFKFLDPKSISITLTSSDCHKLGVVQNNTPRRITPRECARLQGFPDSFVCHPDDIQAYKQFGNSVTVPVIKKVIHDLLINNGTVFSTELPTVI